ncbi:lytic transglycosylase domain-containing protein [Oceanospirillum sediminis]|uniref:Lytic transglycosylase domain-containing protein n=1 Tax=Oceanospirillum sediminis TaxID=2760088 RepID=A0A839IRZ6_9GAMM|nr:lytic transglycosylase domain-containing protein [Oceanospirillum sediminis]MBB1487440.1 lytic transglycosylase domain-containing protein [Oceanospirillum sediminis]
MKKAICPTYLFAFTTFLWTGLGYSSDNQNQTIDRRLNQIITKAALTADFPSSFTARTWFTTMSQRLESYISDSEQRIFLLQQVHHYARQNHLMPELVLAIIEVESHFRSHAVSPVGARGLMQVMPFWIQQIGQTGDDLFNLETNLKYGCQILSHYLLQSDNNLPMALALYNGSKGRTSYPEKVMKAWRDNWQIKR